jgi:hypothetical protein
MPPSIATLHCPRSSLGFWDTSRRTYLSRQSALFFGIDGNTQYRTFYSSRRDISGSCFGSREHEPEVRSLVMRGSDLHVNNCIGYSPRPTPEISEAVDRSSAAHDCIQVCA